MACVVLDSGAIIALANREVRARAYIVRARRQKDDIVIPSVVIVETTRGKPSDAPVHQVFNEIGVPFTSVTAEVAHLAAGLLGRHEDVLRNSGIDPRAYARERGSPIVDAIVAAIAVDRSSSVIITSDPGDMSLLVEGHDHVRVYPT